MPLLVVKEEGPALLGRNWLEEIKINWPRIKQLTSHDKRLEEILQKHSPLFGEGLGALQGTKARIHVDPTATPMFHKARPVPYALRENIEQDLERLQKARTIEPIQYSEWATPIVPVMKNDGTVRVCGDYKLTVNKVSKLDGYPIPKLDDLYTKLAGGQTFTELDLSHAYEPCLETINASPVDAAKVKLWTTRDPVLSQVLQFVLYGWPLSVEEEALKPYFVRREELSVHAGCLLWGSRVVIPPQGREEVLNVLHESHPGIVRMKSLARSYVWWPKMDARLEEKVKSCAICQSHQSKPPCSPLHPWEWPGHPWSRVHVDYAVPFMGKMFLLIIDAHSKWMDIHCVNSATSSMTIEKLRTTFASHGLPEIVVTNNGSNFMSSEFKSFLQKNGIRHITSAPYHPSSNGLVERAVRTFKQGMKKQSDGTVETKLNPFLLSYRITPQSTTGESPAQLRWGRSLRSHLDLLRLDVGIKVYAAQSRQKKQHNQHSRMRQVGVGDSVNVRNYSRGPKWVPGTVIQETGPLSARIELEDGTVVRKHHDQVVV